MKKISIKTDLQYDFGFTEKVILKKESLFKRQKLFKLFKKNKVQIYTKCMVKISHSTQHFEFT